MCITEMQITVISTVFKQIVHRAAVQESKFRMIGLFGGEATGVQLIHVITDSCQH